MPSKKERDIFYATGFLVSRPLLKLDVIKNVYIRGRERERGLSFIDVNLSNQNKD